MINSKKIGIVVAAVMILAVVGVSLMVVLGNSTQWAKTTPAYATKVFGTDIITIEVIADESQWQEMLDNPLSEEYIMVDVVVNGQKFQNVGIRPKGNSSLSQVANSDSDRYSFRIKFDKYIKDQSCFGLTTLVVNNMISDYTYMKEYISFDLMAQAGVETPYFSFADITVNGQAWGFYLAIELYGESYEQRVSADTSGVLYNVKSMDMGGNNNNQDGNNFMPGGGGNFDFSPFEQSGDGQMPAFPQGENEEMPAMPQDEGGEIPAMPQGEESGSPDGQEQSQGNRFNMNGGRGGGMGGGMGGGAGGGTLVYTDDESSSYSAIFGNSVADEGTEKDFQRVITALKALSQGEELETYWDVDQILRYLAAHTIVVNLDSYSSSMAQNFYLYELDGKVTVLPWDYNLAWGGFQSGSASSVVNFPIDTPVSGVSMEDRPLISMLFAVPEYLERYHSYLQELLDNYFADGKFDVKIAQLDALISNYVENDPGAFCTYEQYQAAVPILAELGNLRAQSIQRQLDGTIPSTTQGQSDNPDALVSADDIQLSALGTMGGGGGGGRNQQQNDGRNNPFGDQDDQQSGNNAMPPQNSDQQGGNITPPQETQSESNNQNTPNSTQAMPQQGQNDNPFAQGNMGGGNNRQNWGTPTQNSNTTATTDRNNQIILLGASVLALIIATIIVSKIKRKY